MKLAERLKIVREVGLSKNEQEAPQITDEPKVPLFLCFPNSHANEKYYSKNSFGQGYHPNETLARIKSHGEYLERLCVDNLEESKLIRATYNGRKGFVNPNIFPSYSSEQVNKKEFLQEAESSEYKWYPVRDLINNKEVFIPGQMLFLSPIFDDEFQIRGERITTGASFGVKDEQRNLNSAILEVIERDSCIGAYLLQKNLQEVVNLPPELDKLNNYLRRYQLETHIFNSTSDLNIPTALAITLDKTGIGPAVNVGSKASFNHYDAIQGALLESIQCRRMARITPREDINSAEEIDSMDNRFFYWHKLERINDLDFWLDNTKKVSYDELKKQKTNHKKIIELLKDKNYNLFLADITLPEIQEKGFQALKVVIPELHPMYLSETAKMFSSKHYGEIKDKKLKLHFLT